MPKAYAGAYLNVEIAKVDDPLKKARDVMDIEDIIQVARQK